MCCQRRSRLLAFVILTLSLLFSVRLTWTQEKPSTNELSTQLSEVAAASVAVPEANLQFHSAYRNFSPIFATTQEQSMPQPDDIGSHLSLNNSDALPKLRQPAKTVDPRMKVNNYGIPTEWFPNVNSNTTHSRTTDWGGDVGSYGSRIPWAGRSILGITEKVKSHPRVTHLLEAIDPGMGSGNGYPSGPLVGFHLIHPSRHR